jgi:hypothetical protein
MRFFTLLAVERDKICTSILLVATRDYALNAHTASRGERYTLHVYAAGGGKGKACTSEGNSGIPASALYP